MGTTNFDAVAATTFTGTFVGPIGGGAIVATTITATGVVDVAAGTAAAPEITFTGDLDTGIYHPAANSVAIACGGAAVFTSNASGSNGIIGATTPAAATVTTLVANTSAKIGSGGTALTQAKVYSQTITAASVAAATAEEQTFTVTGVTTADKILVNPAATGNATGVGAARVSAADTVAITYINPTVGALTPGAGTYTFIAFRS